MRKSDKCWRGWLHGSHKVTGPGAGGWPQSRQPDSGVDCGGGVRLATWTQTGLVDHRLGFSIPVITPISDIILILDRCIVYSTRIAYYRIGISCTLRLFWTVHSQGSVVNVLQLKFAAVVRNHCVLLIYGDSFKATVHQQTVKYSLFSCLYSNLRHKICWNYQGNKRLIAPLPNFDVWLAYPNMFASFFKNLCWLSASSLIENDRTIETAPEAIGS